MLQLTISLIAVVTPLVDALLKYSRKRLKVGEVEAEAQTVAGNKSLLKEAGDFQPRNQPIQFYSCFISYSHEDKAFARRLHDALQGRGIRCWLDEKQLLPGDDIHEQVDRGIRLWDKVLLCCSEHSLTSSWVDAEIDKAFQKEQALMKERKMKALVLIPLNLDGYLFDRWANGKASQVRSRLAADFRGWQKSHSKCAEQIEQVVRALRADEHAREKPPMSLL